MSTWEVYRALKRCSSSKRMGSGRNGGNLRKNASYFAIEKGLKEEAKENGEGSGNARYGRQEA